MQNVQKIRNQECSRCDKPAVTKLEKENGDVIFLCVRHEEKLAEKMREEIQEKYEGMSQDEIMQKIISEGDGIL